jgi:Fe-S oxidoreductase
MRKVRCCGRPLISNGMLAKAVRFARHNVQALYSWAAEGKPIMACEPSCLLTVRDDYPALLGGEDRRQAEVVAAACYTFEELAESAMAEHDKQGTSVPFQSGPRRILVQGHCHQRSLVGMEPTMRLLRRIPEAEVIDLDAGCCGMAGSFGYEKEHYEISRLVGEQRLFPAIRNSDAAAIVVVAPRIACRQGLLETISIKTQTTVLVAPGFSCRQQIQHFTRRIAVHPAQLLRSLCQADSSQPSL